MHAQQQTSQALHHTNHDSRISDSCDRHSPNKLGLRFVFKVHLHVQPCVECAWKPGRKPESVGRHAHPTDTLIMNKRMPNSSAASNSRSFTISTGASIMRDSQNPTMVGAPLRTRRRPAHNHPRRYWEESNVIRNIHTLESPHANICQVSNKIQYVRIPLRGTPSLRSVRICSYGILPRTHIPDNPCTESNAHDSSHGVDSESVLLATTLEIARKSILIRNTK